MFDVLDALDVFDEAVKAGSIRGEALYVLIDACVILNVQLAILNASPREAESLGRKYFAWLIHPSVTHALIYPLSVPMFSGTS